MEIRVFGLMGTKGWSLNRRRVAVPRNCTTVRSGETEGVLATACDGLTFSSSLVPLNQIFTLTFGCKWFKQQWRSSAPFLWHHLIRQSNPSFRPASPGPARGDENCHLFVFLQLVQVLQLKHSERWRAQRASFLLDDMLAFIQNKPLIFFSKRLRFLSVCSVSLQERIRTRKGWEEDIFIICFFTKRWHNEQFRELKNVPLIFILIEPYFLTIWFFFYN